VIDDAGSAQARAFLSELYGHVSDIAHKLEAADERNRRARGTNRRDPIVGALKRELHETRRLIDGLHRRFPDTTPHSRMSTSC
jgi:hypothetical protein